MRLDVSVAVLVAVTCLAVAGCGGTTAGPATGADPSAPGWRYPDGDAVVTLEGSAVRDGDVLLLDHAGGWASAPAAAGFDATHSFSVAAWVTVADRLSDYLVAVSQIGDVAGTFYLGTEADAFAFSMKDADTNDPGHTFRAAGGRVVVDPERWVHLVGVFDAGAGTISLYVDGDLVAQEPFGSPWAGGGDLRLGAAQAHGEVSDLWVGDLTGVRVVPAVLDPDAVDRLMDATRPAEPAPVATEAPAQAGGALDGTWDSVLTTDERALVLSWMTSSEQEDLGDLTALRMGFTGRRWWQGFVGDGRLWFVGGVPEGDGGFFAVEGDTIVMGDDDDGARWTWSVVGDELTLHVASCTAGGVVCPDLDVVRFMVERTWTRSGSDASY